MHCLRTVLQRLTAVPGQCGESARRRKCKGFLAIIEIGEMETGQIDEDTYALLQKRVGRIHLQQRLGIEQDYERRVFGQGQNFFHIENWYSVHSLIRNSLRLFLLHGRGRRNARRIQVRHNHVSLTGLSQALEG